MTYDPDNQVIVTVGGSEAIDLAFRAMIDEGDEVLIPTTESTKSSDFDSMMGGPGGGGPGGGGPGGGPGGGF